MEPLAFLGSLIEAYEAGFWAREGIIDDGPKEEAESVEEAPFVDHDSLKAELAEVIRKNQTLVRAIDDLGSQVEIAKKERDQARKGEERAIGELSRHCAEMASEYALRSKAEQMVNELKAKVASLKRRLVKIKSEKGK